ncbi:MAG: DNA polymerase domain-containing protein [Candidatus Paceibacterota bacterium]
MKNQILLDDKMINEENALILDIETKTMSSKPSGELDIHRVTGMYSYPHNKFMLTIAVPNVQAEVDGHKVIVGHNIEEYDRPVLERAGISFDYKIIVDTLRIAKNRLKPLMRIDTESHSLQALAEILNLKTLKGEIDYKIFQKQPSEWTEQEKAEIVKYTKGDIEVTKELFELFYNKFVVFRQFVSEKNQKNWSWLTCSSGSLSYKILCNFAGLEEKYANKENPREKVGGFVLEPTGEEYFDVWYLDFASLYPQIYMMFNLFGNPTLRPDCTDWFTGNSVFEIKGKYAKDKPHILSLKYEYMFKERKKVKKSDPPLAYAYKIILNGGYGVTRSPVFESIFYEHTGADCCRIGQKMNQLIGQFFDEAGFDSVAGDTDSRFLKYRGSMPIPEQKKLLEETTKKLIDFVNANVPFPSSTFELENQTGNEPVKYIKFVKDRIKNKFLKKNYLYVYKDDKTGANKVEIKGMPIIKHSATKVGKRVLEEYIKPKIIAKGICDFSKQEIMKKAAEILSLDISLASVMFKVNAANTYKSQTCIQYAISQKFFGGESGVIHLVKNKRGGEVKTGDGYYCSMDYARTKLCSSDIILEKLENEIEPFVTHRINNQKSLWNI